MKFPVLLPAVLVLAVLATPAGAHHSAGPAAGQRSDTRIPAQSHIAQSKAEVYRPFEFLIGEWEVSPAGGGAPVALTRFTWGPGKSYIWFSTSLMSQGKEVPHFEGMLMWNGVRKNLDMLVTLDLNGGRSQEQGDLSIEPDGTVVRRITAYFSEGLRTQDGRIVGPEGATARFRQTYKAQGSTRVLTTLLRETPKGWVPTFPGSDNLVMKRRPTGHSG